MNALIGGCELRELLLASRPVHPCQRQYWIQVHTHTESGVWSDSPACFSVEWKIKAHQNPLPTPSEGLKMKSLFPLDVHRLREFYDTKNEVAVNVQTQPTEAEDTDSNEIDLAPKNPQTAVAAYKFRRKLESL